jgi:proteic killer suppression protein
MIKTVQLSKRAKADLRRVPEHIAQKHTLWIFPVETTGLDTARMIKVFHDEPLRGTRQGQRSIRPNQAYRAIYMIRKDGVIDLVSVEEVHKHDY